MSRPVIGISTYQDPARWGVWEMPAVLLPAAYPRLVRAAGGLAVLLPPDDARDAARDTVAALDGLVIAGGADVEPARYGAVADPRTGPPARERDAWELELIRAAIEREVPLLGICRGMQLLNVALGGTLHQHLDDHTGGTGVFGSHPVTPVPGTAYADAVPETVVVPAYHHQAVDRLGSGLVASAHAPDGTVEALELPGHGSLVLGVQWHPEMGEDPRVMAALVRAALVRAARGRAGLPDALPADEAPVRALT
ncbi:MULTISPECIES: gamma-glutamyl-gamma-aminobutyrate hydrolase family protein [unclassified Streptomyces]|uniref:gamma-glutamyl-gamma-aminobutyrate hydrolase family protein n=1 Tax=unclassified Streptomyces TaxID=2593676 RepID=UPI000851C75A|nr:MULTISPECIES: gamma-glutamyl-gamma-aminobutyrate hydrolase family protein [unclassified Streptomyces]MBQ1110908.1 gamma-glutamyl-gamma-aminobutyrate hydrolase family protein [Streptomyces sp. 404i]